MPKKQKNSSALGRSLINDRFSGNRRVSGTGASSEHFREYAATSETAILNLKSVTELNSLDEFLETAELAGTNFTAERLNIEYVRQEAVGVMNETDKKNVERAQMEFGKAIRIPRRPAWSSNMTAENLNQSERESFLLWRRELAYVQEQDHVLLTPYEKNLDFWRQLWRVIERSDLVVQIVDARDPLTFRCKDLELYVKEVDSKKQNMILINKADLLSQSQRETWSEYFEKEGITIAFWSAVMENERLESLESDEEVPQSEYNLNFAELKSMSKLLTRSELIFFCKSVLNFDPSGDSVPTVGMVGYPNVGKSSTINTILRSKRVAVSATPGRTKHFQTFFVDDSLELCDCPGLVFPSFVSSKAEMVLSGILSIDEMRDHVGPVNLLCQRIDRKVMAATYGINIAKPREGEDVNRPPTAHELLDAYGSMRGFMTSHGQPDNPRSARVILKDYVKGKLLHCVAPPTCDQVEYTLSNKSLIQAFVLPGDYSVLADIPELTEEQLALAKKRVDKATKLSDTVPKNEMDTDFFSNDHVKAFTKGVKAGPHGTRQHASEDENAPKPWKKHNNKNKKEKARRLRNKNSAA